MVWHNSLQSNHKASLSRISRGLCVLHTPGLLNVYIDQSHVRLRTEQLFSNSKASICDVQLN